MLNKFDKKAIIWKILSALMEWHIILEVDFVIELSGGMKVPIECKAAVEVKRKHCKNLLNYLELSQGSLGILVSAAPFEELSVNGKCILNIPIYLANKKSLYGYVEEHTKR